MASQSVRAIILIMILIAGLPAFPAEFFDTAVVVRSEPVTRIDRNRRLADACLSKPETDNLLTLLHWDLGTGNCIVEETTETITGYRVYYQWQDQVFSQMMAERPGTYIPVRVEIN
jgi:uncharacterized protein YcfJ